MTFEIENVYPEVILPDYETVIKNEDMRQP